MQLLNNSVYENLVSQLLNIPSEYRRYNVPRSDIFKLYGISDSLLDKLVTFRLPYKVENEKFFFDPYDLNNVALCLSLPSIQRMAMRTWGNTLKTLKKASFIKVNLYVDIIDKMYENFSEDVHILTPDLKLQPLIRISQAGGIPYFFKELHYQPYQFSGLIAELLNEISFYNFFLLPEAVRWDLNFIKKNKICECGGISKYLYLESKKRGLTCRQQYGILIAKPYSTTHFWVEFKVEDQWIAADPLLIKLLTQVTGLSAIDWPLTHSASNYLIALSGIKHINSCGSPSFLAIPNSENRFLSNPLIMINNKEVPFTLKTEFST